MNQHKICCLAYTSKDSEEHQIGISFCGEIKAKSELALYPSNSNCNDCRVKIHKLVGRDYVLLNNEDIMKKIIKIKSKTNKQLNKNQTKN